MIPLERILVLELSHQSVVSLIRLRALDITLKGAGCVDLVSNPEELTLAGRHFLSVAVPFLDALS